MNQQRIKDLVDKYSKYLEGLRLVQGTVTAYSIAVRQFLEWLGKEPKDITGKDLEKYREYCLKYDANSLTVKYSALRHFLKKHKVDFDPNELKAPPQTIKVGLPRVEFEDAQKMFKIAQKKDKVQDEAILKFLWYTAQRRQAIFDLKTDDIHFENGTIILKVKKGGSWQRKPFNLHPVIAEVIDRWLKIRKPAIKDDRHVFLNFLGYPIGRTALNNILSYYAIKIDPDDKLPRITPHAFRRGSATYLHEKEGWSLEDIAEVTGHQSLETLRKHYIQISPTRIKEKYNGAFNNHKNDKGITDSKEVIMEKKQETPTPTITGDLSKRQEAIELWKDGIITKKELEDLLKSIT